MYMTYLSLALCFIPLVALYLCLALLVQGFRKLTGLWACVLGLLALIPAEIFLMFVGTRLPDNTLLGMLVKCILLALIEEGIKMLLLFLLPAKKTPLPVFFAYAVICGMALGCFEAFIYLVRRNVLLWRYAATLIHILCCGLSGLFVYSVRKKNLHIAPFVFAVLFHGVYNYFAGFKDFRHYFAFAVIVIAILECRLRYAFLKDDVEKLSVIGNDNNIVEKGENLKMGLKDLFKGLFGGKKEDAEPTLPEQTVFGKTSNATTAAVSAAEETVEAAEEAIDTAAEIAISVSDSVDEAKSELSSQYPAIDKLFDDDAPQDTVEPKTDLFTSDIDTKLAAVEKKVVSALADSDDSEKKPATRKRASTKSSTSSTTTRRTRKSAAEKDSEEPVAKKKPGRKPGSTNKKTAATKSTTKKSASAEERTSKTGTRKTTAKSSTAKTTKTTAGKTTKAKAATTKSASTVKKAAAKSTTTKTKASTAKATTKKAAAEKTTKAKTTTKKAVEKKPAAKKTTTTKKTSASAKKTTKKS